MWNQLNEFYKHEESEREVIESILDRTLNQHKIDAGEINIKVPDLLLRECEEEIRRVNIYNHSNTNYNSKQLTVTVNQLLCAC